MVSTVRSRPNHYETLGLTPAASDEEILRAFAQQMSMFRARPMAAVAQISVAYETLRNPIKRRAYDASLGLRPKPEPHPPATPRNGVSFIGSAPAGPVQRPAVGTSPRPAPQATPRIPPEAPPEPRMGSFIAESLREPVDANAGEISPERVPQPEPEPRPEAEPPFMPDLGELLADHGAEQQRSALAWKRPAIAAVALVVAVGFAGALLGWSGGNDQGPQQQAEPDMTIALPAAEPAKDIDALSPPPSPPTGVEEQRERSIAAAVAAPRIERVPSPPQQPAMAEDQQAEAGQPAEIAPAEEVAGQPTADAPAAQTVAATLPLPNATIARTIERIGYACGEVASTSAVEGEAAGVYKVTCTSGQSYRAAPVRGRYHFRRWDSQ